MAATRAKNALIICKSVKILKGGEKAVLSKWEPVTEPNLPDLFTAVPAPSGKESEPASTVYAEELYKAGEARSVLNDRSAQVPSFKLENPSRLHVAAKFEEDSDQTVQDVTEEEIITDGENSHQAEINGTNAETHSFPALLGTMVHRLMEMMVSSENRLDITAAVKQILHEYPTPGTKACERGFSEALMKAAEVMRSGGYEQTNGLPRDLLGTLLSADEVYCEVPFCYMDESGEEPTICNGIMDVVYLSEGRWHIVDYKTNADGNDLDRRYAGQLGAYVKAFKAVTGYDSDALTYHIDI